LIAHVGNVADLGQERRSSSCQNFTDDKKKKKFAFF